VILPDHLDSPNGPKMSPTAVTKMQSSRSRDMSFVLDSLDQIEQQIPELKGRIARDKAAVAGHSFGGMIAMAKTGLRMESQVDGQPVVMADDRFQATVVMSGVGQMEPRKRFPEISTMSSDAFAGLQGPLIASGGTLDVGNVGTGEIYPWQWRMAAYTLAPPGDKYSLVLENTDHYLGGLICRENRGGEDDPVAVEVVRTAQTAFLDAYIKGDSGARDWLRSNNFDALSQGRADFEYK
jgi:pimeloyl-ACP methyl ester carboxylesterase